MICLKGSRYYIMKEPGICAHYTAMTIAAVRYGEWGTKVVKLLKQLFNPFRWFFSLSSIAAVTLLFSFMSLLPRVHSFQSRIFHRQWQCVRYAALATCYKSKLYCCYTRKWSEFDSFDILDHERSNVNMCFQQFIWKLVKPLHFFLSKDR